MGMNIIDNSPNLKYYTRLKLVRLGILFTGRLWNNSISINSNGFFIHFIEADFKIWFFIIPTLVLGKMNYEMGIDDTI